MRLECPTCKTVQAVPDDSIAAAPTKCAKCHHLLVARSGGRPAGAGLSDVDDFGDFGGGTMQLLQGAVALVQRTKQSGAGAGSSRPPARPAHDPRQPPPQGATKVYSHAEVTNMLAEAPAHDHGDKEGGATSMYSQVQLASMLAEANQAETVAGAGAPLPAAGPAFAVAEPAAESSPAGEAASPRPEARPSGAPDIASMLQEEIAGAPAAVDVPKTMKLSLGSSPAARAMSGQAKAGQTAPEAGEVTAAVERRDVEVPRARLPALVTRARIVFGAGGFVAGLLIGGVVGTLASRGGPAETPLAPAASPPAIVAATDSRPPSAASHSEPAATTGTEAEGGGTNPALAPPAATPPAQPKVVKPARYSKRAVGLTDPATNGCLAIVTKRSTNVLFNDVKVATTPTKCVELPAGLQTVVLENASSGAHDELQVDIRAGETAHIAPDR